MIGLVSCEYGLPSPGICAERRMPGMAVQDGTELRSDQSYRMYIYAYI